MGVRNFLKFHALLMLVTLLTMVRRLKLQKVLLRPVAMRLFGEI
jgi:hypothetical protein